MVDTAPEPESAPAPPKLDEYQTSGRRFVRWNLVSLVLGLVALAIGLLVVKQQRAAAPAPTTPGAQPAAPSGE